MGVHESRKEWMSIPPKEQRKRRIGGWRAGEFLRPKQTFSPTKERKDSRTLNRRISRRKGLAESSAPVRAITALFRILPLASGPADLLRGPYNSTELIYRQITCVTVNQMSRTKNGECRINIRHPTTSLTDIPQSARLRLL
ncbi:hypothetical protein TNCV_2629261 [Trichonephila clavipes]|uniref:Uncharacterized protein n=1 Tax=Trichonephila clavipes TaxID=2585209 RepID=A0A8X6SA63_TRICX|nr:hypothetical protein TNCV_2629261 [Trichonephila clavipes]